MNLGPLVEAIEAFRRGHGTFVVGLTGAVAVGKSTMAAALAPLLGDAVETVGSDGFLLPNSVLDARGLTLRKGFPETYDLAAMGRALCEVRAGPARFPVYSHVAYDIDETAARILDRPAVLIIEGLGLGLERPRRAGLIDCLIYLDADQSDLETWFTRRFLEFWEGAEHGPASFYARFRNLDREGAAGLAREVWRGINLPNLHDHIEAVRGVADIVAAKAADHSLESIETRTAPPRRWQSAQTSC